MWTDGRNIYRQKQDTRQAALVNWWDAFCSLKMDSEQYQNGKKKFRHNQGMIMILSCFLMDSLRNTLIVVLMHFTQRKTKSINYWLTNSPTCPAVSFFVVYNDTFYQLTTEVLIGECILNICNCIFLSDRSFYLLNWHILIEIYCINYKLFISNPNIKRHLWSNNSTF